MSATMTREELQDAGLGRWVWWAHQKLQGMQNRGDNEDFENRYTAREMEFLINAAVKDRGNNQYGGVNGGGAMNLNTALLSLIIAVLVPGGAWIISTLITHTEKLAKIECQMNPASCLQLQVPHVP